MDMSLEKKGATNSIFYIIHLFNYFLYTMISMNENMKMIVSIGMTSLLVCT